MEIPLITILTSAAVGALVSSVITVIGQALERRGRRREMLLQAAMELAKRRSDRTLEIAEKTGRPFHLDDDVIMAEPYYRWLRHLFQKGRLPKEAHDIREASAEEVRQQRRNESGR